MENITIQDILEATDGTLLCGDPSMKIDHLSTNSMEIGPNTLFVPIIGERVDAHIFIPNALKEGGAMRKTSISGRKHQRLSLTITTRAICITLRSVIMILMR